jgi:hypothetical protein
MNDTVELFGKKPDDTKDSGIIEGLTKKEGYGFIVGILVLSIPLAVYFMKKIYDIPYKLFTADFKTILKEPDYNKATFTELYNDFSLILKNNKMLYHKWVLLLFIWFAYMAFMVNPEDANIKEPSKLVTASIVGASMFILKFIPSIIGFFENTFGYFFVNLFSSPNLTLSLQNKQFKGDNATIKLNQLLNIFDVENLGVKFNEIGLYEDNNKKPANDGSLFAIFKTTNDATNNNNVYDFFERLLNASIMKRAIGETTMLVFTTFITISLFKQY